MRVMVILKASPGSEAGVMPKGEDMERVIRYNEELVIAGVLKSADGLKPSKFGKRITYHGHGRKSVADGPFAETKEIVAGYWILEVKSMDEAMEWVMRCPDPSPGQESDIEVRPFYGSEDFGAEFSPELQEPVEVMHCTTEP
jgi:hypothetical protein